jgi:hypothetical protein
MFDGLISEGCYRLLNFMEKFLEIILLFFQVPNRSISIVLSLDFMEPAMKDFIRVFSGVLFVKMGLLNLVERRLKKL